MPNFKIDLVMGIVSKIIFLSILVILISICSYFTYFHRSYFFSKQTYITPIILNIKSPILTKEDKNFFKKANPFGFIIFPHDIISVPQVKNLTDELRALFPKRKIYIALDQEGGRVDRLRKMFADRKDLLKSAAYYGKLAEKNLDHAKKELFLNSKNTAKILKELGFDINFAPMLDLLHSNVNNHSSNTTTWSATEDRSFSEDPEIVTILGKEFINGMHAGGMLVTMKHVPGLGRTYTDTHDTEAIIDADLESLINTDFVPFRKLAAISDFAMVGHATYTQISLLPASLSHDVINIIREEIGFTGLLISDALNMKALEEYSLEEKIHKSLKAGIDIVVPNDLSYTGMISAINSLDKKSIARFNRKLKEFEKDWLGE